MAKYPKDYRERFDYKAQLAAPVKTWAHKDFDYPNPNIRPLFYEGPDYQGKPTRVFAWVGLPEGASRKAPVPGIVLVHGGGATAVANWVELWNKMGFAAISMDTCGGIPCWHSSCNYRAVGWPRHRHSGPIGWGGFENFDKPRQEQWMYHAVASVIRGANLLCSLPEVDAGKVGIAGISWGGYLTNAVLSMDQRYKFAVPIYGCSFCENRESTLCPSKHNDIRDAWFDMWDPRNGLSYITTPTLFLNDAEDRAFPLSSWQHTVSSIKNAPVYTSLRFNYPHNHCISYNSKTIPAFARAMLNGTPLPQLGAIRRIKNGIVSKVDMQGRQVEKCLLAATRATGPFVDRTWREYPASYANGKATSDSLPENASAAFFQIQDSEGCLWTSPVLFNAEA